MNTNLFDSSPNGGGSGVERLERALQEINVDLIARQTRFCRRTPRKLLSPLTFLRSCFLVLLQDSVIISLFQLQYRAGV